MVEEPKHTIFLSAAEPSADNHCAALIEQLRERLGPTEFVGLGGDAMALAGCTLLDNLPERAAMLTHALGQVGHYWKLRRRVRRFLQEERPGLVIVCDSPAWNFHVAKAAKRAGIPVLFYVAPQLWAWGPWRLKKLTRCADHIACLLPFEEQWFRNRGIAATYVGHPLFDTENPVQQAQERGQASRDYPTVALLPGSRGHEISHLWPVMQEVALGVRKRWPEAKFVAATRNQQTAQWLREHLREGLDVEVAVRGVEATVRHADLALVASGTATLQVAAQQCPMMVLYRVGRWQWRLVGRRLLKTRYLSLVNILAGREVAPEFIPLPREAETLVEQALDLLGNDEKRGRMRAELAAVIAPLAQPGAAARTAELAEAMLGRY